MRNPDESPPRRGYVLRDILIGSLIVGLSVLFVEAHWGTNQAISRGAICQSNIRQVGIALFMYSVDYDDKLPTTVGSFTGIATSARPYMRDNSSFYCPNTNTSLRNRRLGYRTPALYAGLSISAGWPDPYLGGRAADPERSILLYETNSDDTTAIEPSYRHNGGAICLMFTGQTCTVQDLRRHTK